jgi:acetoin utilization deacetylase AcuC-like enzyme
MQRTGYVYDKRFLLHDVGFDDIRLPTGKVLDPEPHPSSLRILRRTAQLVANSGLAGTLVDLPARRATREELDRVHEPGYVRRVEEAVEAGGGTLAGGLRLAPGSWEAALLAAGTAVTLVDAVFQGTVSNAFGLVRPPGHHATAGAGTGTCVFNNVAVAARHAEVAHGLDRIAIVDWDVHHGNGTQEIFWHDPGVLVVSLHQEGWYPEGSGGVEETGGPDAPGTTVNIPLPAGAGDRAYGLAFDKVIEPVLRAFRPGLLLVSAGQDANMMDPLGRMLVTADGFRSLGERFAALADELCEGRLVGVQEGGYSPAYVPFCVLAVIEGLCGERAGLEDPFAQGDEARRGREVLRAEHEQAVERARQAQEAHWPVQAGQA